MPKDLRSWTKRHANKPTKSKAETSCPTKHHSTGGTDILNLSSVAAIFIVALALFIVAGVVRDDLDALKAQADLSTQRLDNLCTHFKTGCTQKYVR